MMNSLLRSGRWIFAFAIAALGAENIFCAHGLYASLGPNSHTMPVLPFLPAIPWLVVLFGILWIACAIGLLTARWLRASAYTLGATYIFWTLVHVLPYYIASPGDMGLRTVVFEPLSLACIALLLPGPAATPKWLSIACRAVIAIAMIVFGVDHFIGIGSSARCIPGWIPWHEPWVAFFGVVFIAAGIGIGLGHSRALELDRDRDDVRRLGDYAAPSAGAGPLRHPRRPAEPRRVVESLHRRRPLGWAMGRREPLAVTRRIDGKMQFQSRYCRTTTPFFITKLTCSTTLMSSSGLPGTATISA